MWVNAKKNLRNALRGCHSWRQSRVFCQISWRWQETHWKLCRTNYGISSLGCKFSYSSDFWIPNSCFGNPISFLEFQNFFGLDQEVLREESLIAEKIPISAGYGPFWQSGNYSKGTATWLSFIMNKINNLSILFLGKFSFHHFGPVFMKLVIPRHNKNVVINV